MTANRFILMALTAVSALFVLQAAWIYSGTLFWRDSIVFDKRGYALGVDFVNSWMMGYLSSHAPSASIFYQLDAYYPKLQSMFGEAYSQQLWSYPPHYVWLMMPFGLLSYMHALYVFLCLNIACYLAALWQIFYTSWKRIALAGLVSPAAAFSLISGQMTLALTALQCMVFHWMDHKPLRAGMLLGLMTIKPQLGLAYPFFLIATRRWRVLMAAAVTALVLMVISSVMLGADMWTAYFAEGAVAQHHYMMQHTPIWTQKLMPTLFMDLRNAGVDYAQAIAAQAAVALMIAGFMFTPRFLALSLENQMPVVAAAGILITPYLMPYDTLFFVVCALQVLDRHSLNFWRAVAVICAYYYPVIYRGASEIGLHGTALLPLLVLWLQTRNWRPLKRTCE